MDNAELIESKILKTQFGIKHAFFTKNLKGSTSQYNFKNDKELDQIISNNRQIATSKIDRDAEDLIILKQIHSNKVLVVDNDSFPLKDELEYDAIVTNIPKITLGILSADCVPIIVFEPKAKIIAAIHAGWKGAYSGIIENTISEMVNLGAHNASLIASIGPCIRQDSYEIDQIFYDKFITSDPVNKKYFVNSINPTHFMFDLANHTKDKLIKLGITKIDDCNIDTFTDKRFISYRRCIKENNIYESNMLSVISLDN